MPPVANKNALVLTPIVTIPFPDTNLYQFHFIIGIVPFPDTIFHYNSHCNKSFKVLKCDWGPQLPSDFAHLSAGQISAICLVINRISDTKAHEDQQ